MAIKPVMTVSCEPGSGYSMLTFGIANAPAAALMSSPNRVSACMMTLKPSFNPELSAQEREHVIVLATVEKLLLDASFGNALIEHRRLQVRHDPVPGHPGPRAAHVTSEIRAVVNAVGRTAFHGQAAGAGVGRCGRTGSGTDLRMLAETPACRIDDPQIPNE